MWFQCNDENVSYTLDVANEQYEVMNLNPAPKSNGTTGASNAADVLAGLANTFGVGMVMSNRSCPSGSAVWFAPLIYSMMSITFLVVMAAGISGLVAGICGDKNLLNNVGSLAMIAASLLLIMFTIFSYGHACWLICALQNRIINIYGRKMQS